MNNSHADNIMAEHDDVKKLISTVGESMNDLEAHFRLENERFDWSQSSLTALSEKQSQLLQTIDSLWESLKNHFEAEAQYFPGVFGETITRAILTEHDEIAAGIERIKNILSDTRLEGISQGEMLARKAMLQDEIGRLSGMIEEHAGVEDSLFKLVRKAGGKASHK
jgi:uncharacterized small protein (DUF1192 family)